MISYLLGVAKLIPELTNRTASEGSNITVLSITWPARFVFDSQLKYSVKNVPCFGLASEWSLRHNKQASKVNVCCSFPLVILIWLNRRQDNWFKQCKDTTSWFMHWRWEVETRFTHSAAELSWLSRLHYTATGCAGEISSFKATLPLGPMCFRAPSRESGNEQLWFFSSR